MTTLNPGTPQPNASSGNTLEQDATLQRLQTTEGRIGAQYAGSLLLPDGSLSRDYNIVEPFLNAFPARRADFNATVAAGRHVILVRIAEGMPAPSTLYATGAAEQTVQEQAVATLVTTSTPAKGYSHLDAIRAAEKGIQTDGSPVNPSYLAMIAQWALAEGISWTPPSSSTLGSLSVAATPPASPAPVSPVQYAGGNVGAANVAPVFTSGATIPEPMIYVTPPAPIPVEPVKTQAAMEAAAAPQVEAAKAVAAADAPDRTMLYVGLAIAAVVILVLSSR